MTVGRPLHELRTPRVLALAALFLLSGAMSACDEEPDEEDQYVNCINPATNEVVDPDYCDEGHEHYSATYVLWVSDTAHPVGYSVPAKSRSYIANTPAARSAVGLNPTGKVTGKVSSGGFGKGGSGKGGGGS